MKESHKCFAIAAVTLVLHFFLHTSYVKSPSFSGHTSVKVSRKLASADLDLSSFPPLHTIAFNGKEESTLFTSMLWNVSNAKGDTLQIPGHSDTRYHLMVDVGLETGSGLMCMLQELNHTNKVLLGFESHPINFGISSHSMLKGNPTMADAKSRMQLLPFALADTDKYVKFNENYAPACGSILESAEKAWWCALTSNVMYVPALTLNTILGYVPQNYDYHYLKIDVEGAEELVLLGGSKFVPRFRMISLEMNDDTDRPNRVNEANMGHVSALLKRHGFLYKLCEKKRSFDCHFAKTSADVVEAQRLHALAIYTTRDKMTKKKCKLIYNTAYKP